MIDQIPLEAWAPLQTVSGGARDLPGAIDRMLHARSAEDAESAYSQISNNVVVRGLLFEAAVPTAAAVSRAVCTGDYTAPGLPRALDLLVGLAFGEALPIERERPEGDLGARCRDIVREGLDCIKSLVDQDDERVLLGVLELVDLLDVDQITRREFVGSLPLSRWPDTLRSRAEAMGSGA